MASQSNATAGVTVQAVQSIGLTVSDANKSIDFFTGAFDYEVTSDTVISGDEASYLYGVPNAQVRVVSLQSGNYTPDAVP